jgi:hypothetical protein
MNDPVLLEFYNLMFGFNQNVTPASSEPRCPVCRKVLELCPGHPQPEARAHVKAADVPRYAHQPGCKYVAMIENDCECGDSDE